MESVLVGVESVDPELGRRMRKILDDTDAGTIDSYEFAGRLIAVLSEHFSREEIGEMLDFANEHGDNTCTCDLSFDDPVCPVHGEETGR